jgi:hypothetical protein
MTVSFVVNRCKYWSYTIRSQQGVPSSLMNFLFNNAVSISISGENLRKLTKINFVVLRSQISKNTVMPGGYCANIFKKIGENAPFLLEPGSKGELVYGCPLMKLVSCISATGKG